MGEAHEGKLGRPSRFSAEVRVSCDLIFHRLAHLDGHSRGCGNVLKASSMLIKKSRELWHGSALRYASPGEQYHPGHEPAFS